MKICRDWMPFSPRAVRGAYGAYRTCERPTHGLFIASINSNKDLGPTGAKFLEVIGTKPEDFSSMIFIVPYTSGFYSPSLVFLDLRFLHLGLEI
jgi:hypothetical protein